MELIEAINLASSKESLSFTQIKEVNEVLSANKYKDKVIYLYNKDIKHMSNNVYHKK